MRKFGDEKVIRYLNLLNLLTIICFIIIFTFLAGAECLIGNPNLLAVLDQSGTIKAIRWEKIWGENQLGGSIDVSTADGVVSGSTLFLLRLQNDLYSLQFNLSSKACWKQPYIPAVSVEGMLPFGQIKWERETFVHPAKDVVCTKVSLFCNKDMLVQPELIVFFNFFLSPPPIQNDPFVDESKDFRRCNFILVGGELPGIVFFRPYKLSRRDLRIFQDISEGRESILRSLKKFEDGVYLAIFSPNPGKIVSLFENKVSDIPIYSKSKLIFRDNRYVGDNHSLSLLPVASSLDISTESIYHDFYVYIAFARSHSELVELVKWVNSKGYFTLFEEMKSSWFEKRDSSRVEATSQSHWLRVELSTEPTTGAIIPNPGNSNKISILDSCVLVSELLADKMCEKAKKQLLFWAEVVNQARRSGRLALPVFVYPDATSATPEYWTDITTNAMYLYLCNLVAPCLSGAERKCISDIWDTILWAGNQLALWRAPNEYLPSSSFSLSALAEITSVNLVVRTLIGLKSGQDLCKFTFNPIPEEWIQREKALFAWLRLAIFNKEYLPIYYESDIPLWKKALKDEQIVWSLPVVYQGKQSLLRDVLEDGIPLENSP